MVGTPAPPLRLLCASSFIFPRAAALTFSAVERCVFRASPGSRITLSCQKKRRHEAKVMSVPPDCLLNLRRHYFAAQHDCIHITAHPTKVTATPPACRPCAGAIVWGRGLVGSDRDPSALMDSRSSMTHQSAGCQRAMGSVAAASEVKTASSERRVDERRLMPLPSKKAAIAGVPGMMRGRDDGCGGGQGSRLIRLHFSRES